MHQEQIGVLGNGGFDGGLGCIHCHCDPGNLASVLRLQPVESGGVVRDLPYSQICV